MQRAVAKRAPFFKRAVVGRALFLQRAVLGRTLFLQRAISGRALFLQRAVAKRAPFFKRAVGALFLQRAVSGRALFFMVAEKGIPALRQYGARPSPACRVPVARLPSLNLSLRVLESSSRGLDGKFSYVR